MLSTIHRSDSNNFQPFILRWYHKKIYSPSHGNGMCVCVCAQCAVNFHFFSNPFLLFLCIMKKRRKNAAIKMLSGWIECIRMQCIQQLVHLIDSALALHFYGIHSFEMKKSSSLDLQLIRPVFSVWLALLSWLYAIT